MSKLSNLLEKDLKIVEKRKFIFLVPICVVVLAIIMGIIFHFTSGSALNLGMDFSGGYTLSVNVGANLTEENTDTYKNDITKIVEGYTDADGNPYNIKIDQILVTGTGDNTSLQVKFKSIAKDETMETIVEGLIEEINASVTTIRPRATREGNVVTCTYNLPLDSIREDLTKQFAGINGATNLDFGDEFSKKLTFTYDFGEEDVAAKLAEFETIMAVDDTFAASVFNNGKVGATVSQDLLYNAISAILIALVLMLVYIAIRFEFKSGISAIVALLHDLLVMFAFMIIFHIEFNSTFIAALITILGYSINNAIILFDRVRGNLKLNQNWDKFKLANTSISQSFIRCMNTTITTVIMIGSVAVVCAIASIFNPDLLQMVTFALPIIIGLLSGLFSSMFIAPSVWVSLGDKGNKKEPTSKPVAAEAKE